MHRLEEKSGLKKTAILGAPIRVQFYVEKGNIFDHYAHIRQFIVLAASYFYWPVFHYCILWPLLPVTSIPVASLRILGSRQMIANSFQKVSLTITELFIDSVTI